MFGLVKLYLERAGNELRLAKAMFNLSKREKTKVEPAKESIENTIKFLSHIKEVLEK